jgi:hypothetical protein
MLSFSDVVRAMALPVVGLVTIIIVSSNIVAYAERHGFKTNTMILVKDIIVYIAIIAFCVYAFAIGPK